jgi:hypothetical protein
MRRGRIVNMGVGVVVPVRMPVGVGGAKGMTMGMPMGMIAVGGVGRGGNHGKDVII